MRTTTTLEGVVDRFDVRRVRREAHGVVLLDAVERSTNEPRLLWIPDGSASPHDLAVFTREAERVSTWAHPAHCRVRSVERANAAPFAVLSMPSGECLARALAVRAFAFDEALHIGIALTEALVAAHAIGLVHGRLDGDAVFLDGDAIVVVGAGLWPVEEDAAAHDQHAVAAILAMLLSGRSLGRDDVPLGDVAPHLPLALVEAVSRALAPVTDRFPRLVDFLGALRSARDASRFDDEPTEALSDPSSFVRIVRIKGLCATPLPPRVPTRETLVATLRTPAPTSTLEDDPTEAIRLADADGR